MQTEIKKEGTVSRYQTWFMYFTDSVEERANVYGCTQYECLTTFQRILLKHYYIIYLKPHTWEVFSSRHLFSGLIFIKTKRSKLFLNYYMKLSLRFFLHAFFICFCCFFCLLGPNFQSRIMKIIYTWIVAFVKVDNCNYKTFKLFINVIIKSLS